MPECIGLAATSSSCLERTDMAVGFRMSNPGGGGGGGRRLGYAVTKPANAGSISTVALRVFLPTYIHSVRK